MPRLIDADALYETANGLSWRGRNVIQHALLVSPTIEAVPLAAIYRIIAGHSDYHGDNILAALTCIAEGKAVNPVKPLEAEPVRHGRWVMTLYATTSKRNRVIANKKFACSECGYGNGRKQSNYCPNCGAKMDGDSHEA